MKIFNYILKLFKSFFDSAYVNNKVEYKKTKTYTATIELVDIYYNRSAFLKARDEFLKNMFAFFMGKQTWERGTIEGQRYNSPLYIKTNNNYTKIYRYYSRKGLRLIKEKQITKLEYDNGTKKISTSTFCNVCLGTFTKHFTSKNIQYFHKTGELDKNGKDLYREYKVNVMYEKLKEGYYNDSVFEYKQCNRDEALFNSSQGGLSFVIYRNPIFRKSGHVSILTGRIIDKKYPELLQAGRDTTLSISYPKVFRKITPVKYYKLIKKV